MNTDQRILFPAAGNRTPAPPQSSHVQQIYNPMQQTAFRVPSLNMLPPPVSTGNFPSVKQAPAQGFPTATRVPQSHHHPHPASPQSLPTNRQVSSVPSPNHRNASNEKQLFGAKKTRD